MLIPALVAAATTALLGVTAYLLTHPESTVRSLEHEVDRICREARYGWDDEYILKHHPDFCTCQIHYLRAHGHQPWKEPARH
jgi:cupin superfamily acireductone dioxygenase involved in methionine salvage